MDVVGGIGYVTLDVSWMELGSLSCWCCVYTDLSKVTHLNFVGGDDVPVLLRQAWCCNMSARNSKINHSGVLMSCQHKNKIKKGIVMNVDQLTDQWFSTGRWFLRDQGSFMRISHCFCFFKVQIRI